MDELEFDRVVERGQRGKRVRRVQEWVSLSWTGLAIDDRFGPATEFAVRSFQRDRGLEDSGVVDAETFDALVEPMRDALELQDPADGLGATLVAHAERHLARHPREVGGQNRGPWVRLYMDGEEGNAWPWCAGFVCHVLDQACRSMGVELPITPSVSCDSLAASAKANDRFLSGRSLDPAELEPGMLFLNRRTSTDWTHVGIVVQVADASQGLFLTIEGNTNDDGDREGYEVCRRIRSLSKKDFIRVD